MFVTKLSNTKNGFGANFRAIFSVIFGTLFVTFLWKGCGHSLGQFLGDSLKKYPLVEIAISVKTDAHTDII